MTEPLHVPLLIGGESIRTSSDITRENPAHPDRIVGSTPEATALEARLAVDTAHAAFGPWSTLAVEERAEALHSAADALRSSAGAIGDILTAELGKARVGSVGEATFASIYLDQAADDAIRLQRDEMVENRYGRSVIVKRPYGVVSAIVPWNAPLILAMLKIGPALATGNTIVVKPSPLAPLALSTAINEMTSILPAGVLTAINGGADVGSELTSHAAVRKVAFTGGLPTARHVMASAARGVKPVVLELGGNDPAIVLDVDELTDTDIEMMIAATYATSGQVCIAVKRIYVPDQQLRAFVDRFRSAARTSVRMGDPADDATTVGPVITADHAAHVRGLVEGAVGRGATSIEVGTVADGLDPDGYWVRPTVVVDCLDGDPLVTEEQFGPTVPVLGYSDIDDAVHRANDSELGLAASVWGAEPDRIDHVARRLQVGTTFVNSHNRFGVNPGAPFGGTKSSGFGREYGDAGIEAYLQTHAINTPASTEASGYPTGRDDDA